MGRKPIEMDENKLRLVVEQVEANGPLPNQSTLFSEVGDIMGVRPHNIMNRIKRLGIVIKTQKGERGTKLGKSVVRDPSYVRVPRRAKLMPQVRAALLKSTPSKYHYLINRAERSSKALVQLKCLECADYQPKEVKNCGCFDCPIYALRPYKLMEEMKKKEVAQTVTNSFIGNNTNV